MTLAEAFETARPRLEAALAKDSGGYSIIDIWRMLEDEVAQLWHDEGFSGVTEVVQYPQRKVVVVHLAGGELDALQRVASPGGQLDQFAAIVGAEAIEIHGRRGWVKALAEHGFREASVTIERGIYHGK